MWKVLGPGHCRSMSRMPQMRTTLVHSIMTSPAGMYQALCFQGPGKSSIRNSQCSHCFRLAHSGAMTTLTKPPSLLKVAMSLVSEMVVRSSPKICCSTQQLCPKSRSTDQRLSLSMAPLMGQ